MDIRKVRKLIELVKTTDIAELEIHEDKESVRITHSKIQPQVEYQPITQIKPAEPEKIPEIKEPTYYFAHFLLLLTLLSSNLLPF